MNENTFSMKMGAWQDCHPPCGRIEPTWPWRGKWTPAVQLLPNLELRLVWENSSWVVARRHRQAGWVVTPLTVDGDSHSAWQLCVFHGGQDLRRRLRASWKQLCWHVGAFHTLHTIILRPCRQMLVGCQSHHTLFNVWLDLNQKQTSSLSFYLLRSSSMPIHSFLPHSPSPGACQIPASPVWSLLSPRCFPLLPPLKFVAETEWIPLSLISVVVLGGQRTVSSGSQVTRRQGGKDRKERGNEVMYVPE